MFVARPLAALVASLPARFSLRERLMLGWAGLRGAVPIWLATFPVIAGHRRQRARSSTSSSSSSSPRPLIQGATFEPLARRLGLTTDEPALPRPLVESGTIRRLGGEVFAYRVEPDAAIVGRPVRDLRPAAPGARQRDRARRRGDPAARLDRDRGRRRAPHPRPRRGARGGREADAPLARGAPRRAAAPAAAAPRGAPQIFNVRPWTEEDGDARPPRRDRRASRSRSGCAPAATAPALW